MPTDPFSAPLPAIPVGFTGSTLDRADAMRRDSQAMWSAMRDPDARWLAFDELKPVMDIGGEAIDLLWLPRDSVPADTLHIFLGLDNGAPRFAVAAPATNLPGKAIDGRSAAAQLGDGRAEIMAQARSLLDWHARHGFCAVCGAPTTVIKAGYARQCGSCNAEHFPRVDPVVIMLALKDDKALIGRSPGFAPRGYSALAGFVEPGESLEEAVARELFEEAGVRIRRVRYVASQPWPFPSSLMVGAFAEAESFDLAIDRDEIEDARWVTRDEVRAALAGQGDFNVAPPLAIAHTLLRSWVELGDE